MSIILFFFVVAIFIGVPIAIYDKTVEISSKYTFTRFLIAWPMRLGTAILGCGALIVLSFLPITIVTSIIGVILSILFKFDEKLVPYIVYGILMLNAVWLLREIVVTTIKQFIDDYTSTTKKSLTSGNSLSRYIEEKKRQNFMKGLNSN